MKKYLLAGLAACALTAILPASVAMAQDTTQEAAETESQRLNNWFAELDAEDLERFPQAKTGRGIIDADYGRWNEVGDAFAVETHQIALDRLDYMRTHFDFDALDDTAQMSYRLFEYEVANAERQFEFRRHGLIFNQLFGPQAGAPAFLSAQHRIASVEHAEAYIQRIETVDDLFDGLIAEADYRFEHGIRGPEWMYDAVIQTVDGLASGAPFTDGPDHPIWADFQRKVGALEIDDATREDLLERGRTALLENWGPAYQRVGDMLRRHREGAIEAEGVYAYPDGEAFYNSLLASHTTLELTAEEVHQTGLEQIERIHGEMRDIMAEVGFEGSVQDFFEYTRNDPQFYYPNTDEGREAYLAEATRLIADMRARLPDWFNTLPQAEIEVRRVEPFREQFAGKAFYTNAAPDGSRPGIYYANLYDMSDMAIYQMAALAYHEGIPGHHMQRSIQQELQGLPTFRQFSSYTAYNEGWGLYAEYLPLEMGLYDDPYANFGRLSMESLRAARLVVDTGLHHYGWTREQAIDYMAENTPYPVGNIVNEVERYVVFPGQATGYQIGRLFILDLRARAEAALGEQFDIRDFHDAVLRNGSLPLPVLAEVIDTYIADTLAAGGHGASGEQAFD